MTAPQSVSPQPTPQTRPPQPDSVQHLLQLSTGYVMSSALWVAAELSIAAHPAKVIDIEMLFFTGGRERTEEQFRELFGKADLRLVRVIPTKSPYSVIEAEIVPN